MYQHSRIDPLNPRPDEFHLWCERCEDWIYAPSHEHRCHRCSSKWAEMVDPRSQRTHKIPDSHDAARDFKR